MPPTDFRIACPPIVVTTESFNSTGSSEDKVSKDDLNALLYIVVTLLFYSLGIIVGIITYLKREKQEIEEDKCFDEFLQMKRDPFNYHKMEKVHLVAVRLREIEKMKQAREERIKKKLQEDVIAEEDSENAADVEVIDDNVPLTSGSQSTVSRPKSLDDLHDTEDIINKQRKQITRQQSDIFQVTPTGEPISSVVAKIFDKERRGALQRSPKICDSVDTLKSGSSESTNVINETDSCSGVKIIETNASAGKSKTTAVLPLGRCIVTSV